jgi:monomeric isocitrate dehydrogenase
MLCAGLMMSLHMKATMMKISDPIIFGHCVKVYFKVSTTYYLLLVCAGMEKMNLAADTCMVSAFGGGNIS